MEQEERKLVEKILGRDFLNAAETYGRNMRKACAMQGASELIQESLERMATVAFCKGAEFLYTGLWHKLADGYPPLDKMLFLKNDAGVMWIGKVVKYKNGTLVFVDQDGERIPKPHYWLLPPEVKKEEPKSKTIPLKK